MGEIWFQPPKELQNILVKYLFTSEKLSVQVHPSDETALPGETAKDECWLVLDADPDARLAIGFEREMQPEEIEAAALNGSIEQLLSWHEARHGDLFYLPAGTVHAIGPGLSLVEVQQNSETTFRLYDYGRPRELHLDRAMATAHGKPYSVEHRSTVTRRGQTLFDGPYFRIDRIVGAPDEATRLAFGGDLLVLPLDGDVKAQEEQACASAGQCLYASDCDALDFSDAKVTLLIRAN